MQIICSCFSTILSDRGTQFLSNITQQLFKLTGATQLASTACRHQTAGSVERLCGTIKTILAQVTKDFPNK